MRVIWALCVYYLLFGTAIAAEGENTPHQADSRVLFVNPGFAQESFWHDVDLYAQAAADSLGLQLEIIHGERDRLLTRQKLIERMQRGPYPDFVILVNEKGIGLTLLETITSPSTKVTFALNDLSSRDKRALSQSLEWSQRLLPGVFPDNYQIGYLSAQELFTKGDEQPGDFLIISGDKSTPASINREAGATSFVMQNDNTTVAQRVYGDWLETIAYEQTKVLLKRHDNIRYIWTANDHMAFGAIAAIRETKSKIGDDIFVGTINTSKQVLEALAQGEVASLAGGHFTAVGLSLLKIHHYLHGQPWPQRTKYNLFRPIPYPSKLFDILQSKDWQRLDFHSIDIRANPIKPFTTKDEVSSGEVMK
ncbi:ABC transporter substrate-binding protein [Vibrio variabilis]|uniref:ABC transporter substrate-binding protein n=1 Tax=Vibrio variabilis TaxID=990271 RepID=UPI000DDA4651|nr:ABC transporter substrate-binding protein [Vibrio variabilis]